MGIDRETVQRVSLLGRLHLGPAELDLMTTQIGSILTYVDTLAELDVTGVEPMAHAIELHDVFREDVVLPSLDRAEALRNAPDADGECYRVPAVL